MKTILVLILGILAIILTLWLVLIPAGVLVGSVKALRDGGRKWLKRE